MKFLFRICILLLRGLVKIKPLEVMIFYVLKKVPLERKRRERVESYIFGKVALRSLRKQKVKKKKVKKKKKKDPVTYASGSEKGFKSYVIRGKRGFYAACIAFLVFCHKRGLSIFPRAVIWGLKKRNINETRLDSIKSRIYGYNLTPATTSSSEDVIHLETIMTDKFYNRDVSHDRLKAFRTIHIFLETSASIPEFLTSDEFSHVNFVIYAFNDQSGYIETLGIADRTRYRPLRDRFNEISPEGIQLFDFCKSLANTVFSVLEKHNSDSFKGLTKRQREVMTLGLDGRISARLSLAACYREGFAEVPSTDAILFLAVTGTYAVNGWDFYKKVLPPRRSFVLFTTSKLKHREKLTAEYVKTVLRRRVKFKTKVKPNEAPAELTLKADKLINEMSDAFSKTNDTAQRLSSSLGVRLGGSSCTLIAHAEASSNYKVSVEELSREAIDRHSDGQKSTPVLLHCSGSVDKFITPKLLETTDHENFVSLDFSSLAPIISDNMMTRADSVALIDWIETQVGGEAEWMEANIFPIIVTSLAKFFIEQVHWISAGYSFGSALSESVDIDGTLAMPTRHWLIRSVCAGILDGPQGGQPLIDVQSMNILRHPKYRNPMANHCSVIDNTAQNIYRDYFGIPDSQISVVGAPQNDSLQRNLAMLDRRLIAERMNVHPGKKTIVLISQ